MKLRYLVFLSIFSSSISYAADKVVKFATLDWQPYIGQDLKDKGLVAKILEAAYKTQGYKVQLSFTPWARAVEEARQGLNDGLTPEYFDQSRLADFVYSEAFFQGPVGFLTLKKHNVKYNKYDDLNKTYDELNKFKFGVVRDYINEEKFDSRIWDNKSLTTGTAGKDLASETADSDETNVKKLNGERIQIIFIDKYVGSYFINKNFKANKDQFMFLEPALKSLDLFIAFSKKAPNSDEKRTAFNEGMKKIKADGTLKKMIDADIYFK